MFSQLDELRVATSQPIEIIDITNKVRELVAVGGVGDGLLILISNHSTAFISLNENEANLQRDMVDFLARIAPPEVGYRHDIQPVDARHNAHSHLLGLFMTASVVIPVQNGRLVLGTWQSILFVELDGPRENRSLSVYTLGTSKV